MDIITLFVCITGSTASIIMSSATKLSRLLQPPNVPTRLLLGPGPANPPPEVLQAMTLPMLGYLHPEYCQIMDDVKAGLQYVFKTNNLLTFAVSGTGHAGMECSLMNLIEPGETVLIAEHGLWGSRAAEISSRIGANVQKLIKPHGQCFTDSEIEEAISLHKPTVFYIVHGESSTGVRQPLDNLGSICKKYNCILLVDTVASLGGADIRMDEMGIDAIYSGSQKVLGCPPGLAPISFNEKAKSKILNRKTKPFSYYLDVQHVGNYWGCFDEPRRYHHTGMISLVYALRQSLAVVAREGIDECISRHADTAQYLYDGLSKIGLECYVEEKVHRLPTLTTVKVPDGVDWKAVVDFLMTKHGIEIAGGLGPTVGKIWRVGLMGYNSKKSNVDKLIPALDAALKASRSAM